MAAVNLFHELVEHYDDFRNIVDNVEWFIIPVANPDGYEFSRTEGVSGILDLFVLSENNLVHPSRTAIGSRTAPATATLTASVSTSNATSTSTGA
jgi:hypothetical protein